MVIIKPPITYPTNNFALNSTTSNDRSNNYFPLLVSIGGSDSSYFGIYQQISVDSDYVTIRALVPATISTEPYRKALITNLFFCLNNSFTDTPSVSFSDLITAVALYFSLNTGSAEREAKVVVTYICCDLSCVDNLQG